ncbi:protein argonaute 2-like isoform X2 [Vigna umbellata]|uniref:protein argonaute 2-like isoform X1 n=1 Tax=Vigna umbellata TaxID=87088 RepID=UPI001F5EE924|nr:protein argonaute 2-like isoform X1 [Vigna umbellata]XP_047158641.1 protein argonaute 2-like isoform X2 [Vigna umbellata]
METGAGGSQAQRSGHTARGIPPPQPPEEPNLRPECRGPSGTEPDLILQPEWRRRRPSAPPSEPSNRGGEEEILLQPEWRRSKPSASASASASASTSVWEPEWRRSKTSSTAFPWDQNYSVRKPSASSSSGVERRGDPNDLWRAAPATDSVVPKLEKLQISKQLPTSTYIHDKKDRISPIQRPDNGGTIAILTSRLRVNHFPVKFDPERTIMHYSVGVKPKVSSKFGQPQKLSKSDLSMIREKLFSDDPERLPLEMTAHDGAKNIYSAVQLPEETFTVEIADGEDEKIISYSVTLTLVNKLRLCKLMDYLSGHNLSNPRDILQGMDVVVKENPARRTVSVGGRYYPTNPPVVMKDLHHGIIAVGGFQHSLKPTSQGLSLCVDYSVLAFRKGMPVLDFLHECIDNFKLDEFEKFRKSVEDALVGLKVSVTHRKSNRKYIISRLTPMTTRYVTFSIDNTGGWNRPKDVSLLTFFKDKYGKEIMYKDIPCLDLGKDKKNYVPMEFCVLVEGQRYPKERLGSISANTLKTMSLAHPNERECAIHKMVQSSDGPCRGGFTQNFGMSVNTTMTTIVGRVLGPPELKLGDPNGEIIKLTVDLEKCHWNLAGRSMVEGKPVEHWGIIDFTSLGPFRYKLRGKDFIQKLIGKYKKLGIYMQEPIWYEESSMKILASYDLLSELLEKINNICKYNQVHLQFLMCVMAKKSSGYKYLKWIAETKLGIVTQCCLSNGANEAEDKFYTNLALKINAKLGGSNVELSNGLPYFVGEGHVMFLGADVNHPGYQDTRSPSIAAVVATINWPAANRYAARVCPQYNRSEKILSFGDVCLELVSCYRSMNGVRPERIVIFRDGVSEYQFDMVLNEELLDLKRAFQRVNYFSTITLIVAQKRHQTRFFPEGWRDGSSSGNILPGTVVDTRVIHPFEFDFYLCSYYGNLGTSKPTHYHVLWDEHKFTSDELQKLIYEMCFTFAKCTKPVSLVPPVYYADLAAYRGRLYHEARIGMQSPKPAKDASSLSRTTSFEQGFYALHADLQNIMFFI